MQQVPTAALAPAAAGVAAGATPTPAPTPGPTPTPTPTPSQAQLQALLTELGISPKPDAAQRAARWAAHAARQQVCLLLLAGLERLG